MINISCSIIDYKMFMVFKISDFYFYPVWIPNQRGQPFFLDLIWKVVKNYTTFVLHIITKYLWGKSYRWKTLKKSDSFSNSIFEPYRATALFELETWNTTGTNFNHFSITVENLKKISRVVSEKISEQKWHPENQKIVDNSERKWRHDLKSLFHSF